MANTFTADLVTRDPENDEFVVYLVEQGPWDPTELRERLQSLQSRIYDAIDVLIEGHFASRYPESLGGKARIQVDAYDDPPEDLESLIIKFDSFVQNEPNIQRILIEKRPIRALRITSRVSMGRA